MLSVFNSGAPIEAQINYIKYHETSYNKTNGLCDKLFIILFVLDEQSPLLTSIENAICYVRDIYKGRGQRDLTYSLLYTYHNFYPERAIEILRKIVYYDHINTSIGCWKDVKQYADFIARFRGYNHYIIPSVMNLYVEQLHLDRSIWNSSVNMDARKCISFAAKYSPRETKNPHLYEICMNLWCNLDETCKKIMDTVRFSGKIQTIREICRHASAKNKCAMLFRKTVASLNKALDTCEIKICDKACEQIDINKVPIKAFFQHKSNLYHLHTEHYDRICNSPFTYSPWMIIKHMLSLDADKEHWNKLWESLFVHIYYIKNYYVPLLDLSVSLFQHENKQRLYTALSYAIIYARCSYISNSVIIAYNNNYINVDLTNCDLDMCLQRLMSITIHFNKESCVLQGLNVVLGGIITSGMTQEEIDVLKIVMITHTEITQEKFDSILSNWALSGEQIISEPYQLTEKNFMKLVI